MLYSCSDLHVASSHLLLILMILQESSQVSHELLKDLCVIRRDLTRLCEAQIRVIPKQILGIPINSYEFLGIPRIS